MMDNRLFGIAILALFLSSSAAVFILCSTQHYQPFAWDGGSCITYYRDCRCVGSLIVMESYPPQYSCRGFEFCSETNVTECG